MEPTAGRPAANRSANGTGEGWNVRGNGSGWKRGQGQQPGQAARFPLGAYNDGDGGSALGAAETAVTEVERSGMTYMAATRNWNLAPPSASSIKTLRRRIVQARRIFLLSLPRQRGE
jgi:hypothetical protein